MQADAFLRPSAGLPSFSVRISPRAKRLLLKVSPLGRVEVVVPKRHNPADIQNFVQRHHQWLHHTLARLEKERAQYHLNDEVLPSRIELRGLDEAWRLNVISDARASGGRLSLAETHGDLEIRAADDEAALRVLRAWFQRYAKRRLTPWLHEVSADAKLPFHSLTVRAQKSRWGSCSSRGRINLNRNLLFLPPHLVRHVMLHELCHTVYMNHGPRYWRLVQQHAPSYRECEQELRQADRYIPAWAFVD